MDKNIVFTEKTDIAYGCGYIYSIQFYIVWYTKYRKQVLRGGIDQRIKVLLADMKDSLWGGHLWNPSYCALSVSDRSFEQVKRYIEEQKIK